MSSYSAPSGKEVMDDPCCSGSDSGTFTIDAANYGNVARFINHSCSPNLIAQNVLYDDGDDPRIPHIMVYVAEDILSMNELTFNYNYKIDQVIDSNGNVKMKGVIVDFLNASVNCINEIFP